METKQADYDIDPLFVGMTRPAMFYGVAYTYLLLEVGLAVYANILFEHPGYLLIAAPLHLIGMAICARDAHFFDIVFTKARLIKCPNRGFWKCNSYDPY